MLKTPRSDPSGLSSRPSKGLGLGVWGGGFRGVQGILTQQFGRSFKGIFSWNPGSEFASRGALSNPGPEPEVIENHRDAFVLTIPHTIHKQCIPTFHRFGYYINLGA